MSARCGGSFCRRSAIVWAWLLAVRWRTDPAEETGARYRLVEMVGPLGDVS